MNNSLALVSYIETLLESINWAEYKTVESLDELVKKIENVFSTLNEYVLDNHVEKVKVLKEQVIEKAEFFVNSFDDEDIINYWLSFNGALAVLEQAPNLKELEENRQRILKVSDDFSDYEKKKLANAWKLRGKQLRTVKGLEPVKHSYVDEINSILSL